MAVTLGDLTKKYRKAHKMGMGPFAKKCGLSKAYIAILESGVRPDTKKPPVPSLETILAISLAMEMDCNDVMEKIGLNVRSKEKEIEKSLLAPLSTSQGGASLEPFEYVPINIPNMNAALKEGRVLILPFKAPKVGNLVYVPLKEYDMAVAHTITDVKGGIYTATSEAGGPITFSLFDINHVVFMTRQDEYEAREQWSFHL